jgi:hypothetical protein
LAEKDERQRHDQRDRHEFDGEHELRRKLDVAIRDEPRADACDQHRENRQDAVELRSDKAVRDDRHVVRAACEHRTADDEIRDDHRPAGDDAPGRAESLRDERVERTR